MARAPRVDVGGEIYHVINRSNGRFKIFESEAMYKEFEDLLKECTKLYKIGVLAYIIMPNHWHLLVQTKNDGDLGRSMQWLGNIHTRRFHTKTGTIGNGHLYQGRYKSFLVQSDRHMLSVLKYIERNAARASLCKRALDWQWGSAYTRLNSHSKKISLLDELPVPLPQNYEEWINIAETSEDLDKIRSSIAKSVPFGMEVWRQKMVVRFNMTQVLREVGRPKKLQHESK